ncbi:unnamed protein product, partial [Porites lobata]
VHVSSSSRVSDHCSQYALSDSKDPAFRGTCTQDHDLICNRCEDLKAVLSDTQKSIQESCFECHYDKEDALHRFQEATQLWKSHQLRLVNQDNARIDVIECLDDSKVLLVQDWAMKFLPRQYRESQGEWFAKKGISWHITVAIRKKESELETQAFVHVVEKCIQDSPCVVQLMEHVLSTLKREHPEIKSAFYRQDNAGCYHAANTILACKDISQRSGIFIQQLDFSDPQGGKGACDRFAATMKNHVRSFVNEGNDVLTAEQFLSALTSRGGVSGARVSLVQGNSSSKTNVKWPGISKLNNFELSSDRVRVWRAYQVGEGKFFPWSEFEGTEYPISSMTNATFSNGDFRPIKTRKKKHEVQQETLADVDSEEEEEETEGTASGRLFSCPNEGCVRVYTRYGSMVNHVTYGKCDFREERESVMDTAKVLYSKKLWVCDGRISATANVHCNQATSSGLHKNEEEGWALKSIKKNKPFSDKQKKFLEEKFMVGETTGRKLDPVTVAREMKTARQDGNGERLFSSSEVLTATQIQSFFSRRARCGRFSENDPENQEAVQVEEELEDFRRDVIEQVQPRHPIMYDVHNLCDLVASGKLKKLTLPKLKEICSAFELNLPEERKKAPFVDALTKLVKNCSCWSS